MRRPSTTSSSRLASVLLAGCGILVGCGSPDTEPPTSILLITIDTLRADHLSAYGYRRQTSPVIDELAGQGVRFELPIVQWPKTGPSFASMFTATYPKDNGIVRKIGARLPDEFRLLAEVLRDQGYRTRAVVANGAVASEFNFHQGFDDYIESWKLTPPSEGVDPTGAGMITELAKTLMTGHDPSEPYLLWVHYLDPHFPYSAPAPWTDRFVDDDHFAGEPKLFISPDTPTRQMGGIGYEQVLGDRDELAFYVARYDAEIAYADAQIGELLEFLDERQLMENTLTVITSDHGESLGEHNYFFDHGRFGFQTCLRVPLIFHHPRRISPGVDPDPVELVHLAPTLLEAAGIHLGEGRWMQGRSLWPRLIGGSQDQVRRSPYVFSEAGYETGRKWQRIVLDGRYKLIYAQAGAEQRWIAGKGKPMALYDLEQDPGETVNLAEQNPTETERLKRALDALWAAQPIDLLVDQGTATEAREMDDETRRQLKALGYLQ